METINLRKRQINGIIEVDLWEAVKSRELEDWVQTP